MRQIRLYPATSQAVERMRRMTGKTFTAVVEEAIRHYEIVLLGEKEQKWERAFDWAQRLVAARGSR